MVDMVDRVVVSMLGSHVGDPHSNPGPTPLLAILLYWKILFFKLLLILPKSIVLSIVFYL